MSSEQWAQIYQEIKRREKPSTYLTRNKMKDVLGFTVREHREYVDDVESYPYMRDDWIQEFGKPKRCEFTIRLDFYDEQKRLMFLLKYGPGE